MIKSKFLFSILCCFITAFSFAQTKGEPVLTESKERKSLQSERVLQFKNMPIIDKSNELVMIDNKYYHWFSDKEKAKEYFNTQTLKKDWEIVYIDSDEPNSEEPDIYTISEKIEKTISDPK